MEHSIGPGTRCEEIGNKRALFEDGDGPNQGEEPFKAEIEPHTSSLQAKKWKSGQDFTTITLVVLTENNLCWFVIQNLDKMKHILEGFCLKYKE